MDKFRCVYEQGRDRQVCQSQVRGVIRSVHTGKYQSVIFTLLQTRNEREQRLGGEILQKGFLRQAVGKEDQ